MSNEIVIVVKSRNEAKPGMDKVGQDTDRLKVKARELGAEFDRATKQTDQFGRRLQGSGNFAEFLDVKIGRLREETRRLGEEFNRTGDASKLDKLFDADHALKDPEKIKARLVKTLGDAGEEGSKQVSASLQGATSTPGVGVALTAVIVGAVVAALPAIDALLLSAAGLGGIGLGIAGQFRDPGVKAAIGDMGQTLLAELEHDTTAFREPLIAAAGLFGASLEQALHSINFDRLSKLLLPLTGGLGGLFTGMMPGFNHALEAAEPLIQALAQELPEVGRALSDMFDAFAEGGPGATEALRAVLMLLEGMLRFTGQLVEAFSGVYHQVVRVEDNVANFVDSFAHGIPVVGTLADKTKSFLDHIRYGSDDVVTFGKMLYSTSEQATIEFDKLDASLNKVTVDQDTLAGKMTDKLLDSLLGTAHAALSFEESLTRASESIKQNGKTLDIHTAKGQQNAEAVLAMVDANKRIFDQNIANGASMDEATAKWDENTRRIYAWGAQVGLSKGQLDGLIGTMKSVPDDTKARLDSQPIVVAIDRLDNLIRRLNGLAALNPEVHVKTVYSNVYGSGSGEKAGHHDSGGILGAGFTTVAERARELIRMPGAMVLSNPDTERALAGAQAHASQTSAGGRTVFIGPGIDSAFASYFQQLVATGQITLN